MCCVRVAVLQSHRESAYCCVSHAVVADALDKAASCGMLQRRRCDAPSESKMRRRCRLRLCTVTASCLLLQLQLRRPCVVAFVVVIHIGLCHMYFQNPHKKNTHTHTHTLHVKVDVKVARFTTVLLRISTGWVVNIGLPACVFTTHPVSITDQMSLVRYHQIDIILVLAGGTVASAGRFCRPSSAQF